MSKELQRVLDLERKADNLLAGTLASRDDIRLAAELLRAAAEYRKVFALLRVDQGLGP